MRNLVVFGALGGAPAAMPALRTVTVDGVTVRCAVVPAREPDFDPAAPGNESRVLVRVRALSCNYRDRTFVHTMGRVPAARYSAIGSELAAEVVEVGPAVTSLKPGDRVVADMQFTGERRAADGFRQGVPTNQASRAWHVFHDRKLLRVPHVMPDEAAATFALNAQTAYSMVRRLDLSPGENVLVTSAGSNTSLYAIAALALRGVNVFAATTSAMAAERVRALGVRDVLCVDRASGGFNQEETLRFTARVGGFDAMVDPFFDLHLERAVSMLRPFGRYVTCGFAGQNEGSAGGAGPIPVDGAGVFQLALRSNLTLMGNCLGRTSDLQAALDDYAAGRLPAFVDSVYGGDDAHGFLERSFNASDRFGKVAFVYA